MSYKEYPELGKLVIDLLVGFEKLQYMSNYNKSENPSSIYGLYSSTLKLISRAVSPDIRNPRVFRLKYHHILSNDSVDEYLFHCLSKILSDLLDIENNYQKFIEPVADLHMKLMSILTKIQLEHEKIVLTNRSVVNEIQKRQRKTDSIYQECDLDGERQHIDKSKHFKPLYFVPTNYVSKVYKKTQTLTFQAIQSHYLTNRFLEDEILDMLIDFDNDFADFEMDFICQVNKNSIFSIHQAQLTMNVAVMFSEAVQWAHNIDILQYKSISDCDIEIMVAIPRLAVLYGCRIVNDGPLSDWSLNCLNEEDIEERLAPVFQDHRQDLCRLRRQLNVLSPLEFQYLTHLLCDNHESNTISNKRVSNFKNVNSTSQNISGDMHALFKLVSSVSDQMQSKHASDYRFFMETLFRIYKDEPDYVTNIFQPSFNSKFYPISMDLFNIQYNNVLSYLGNIEEAEDALAFTASNQSSSDNCLDLFFLSEWDSKTGPSSLDMTSSFSNSRTHFSLRDSLVPLNINMQAFRPEWRSDSFFPRCCHCERAFNLFRRRHHCRRCGYLFCNSCWGTKIALPSLGIQNKVSICIECEEFINGKVIPRIASTANSS